MRSKRRTDGADVLRLWHADPSVRTSGADNVDGMATDLGQTTTAAIDRLIDAINAHDLDALTACFAPGYSVTWPAHPARSFTGRENVRRTWTAIFEAHPTVTASATPRVCNGDEVWAEWEFKSQGSQPFWQRGVIIAVVHGDVIGSARFYMEPVTD